MSITYNHFITIQDKILPNIMQRFLVIIFLLIFNFHAAKSTSMGKVDYLPGFQGPLPFNLETGYVGVGDNEDVQLFYYFLESESNPSQDPLLLWLSGGPGCSSISGILFQFGPIQFEAVPYNGSLPSLIPKPHSWTKTANIIFLDFPVGTGFSYAKTTHASHATDIQSCDQAYEFMIKWLGIHPQFITNKFYIGGDSYSGNPVPIITQLISDGNGAGIEPYINLKGYVLGNPLTFPEESYYQIQFANGMGFISDEHYKSLHHSCGGEYREDFINPNNVECVQNMGLYLECIDGINIGIVLEPNCPNPPSKIKLPTQYKAGDRPVSPCEEMVHVEDLSPYWADDASVRKALHVREGTIGEWLRCADINFTRIVYDVREYHLNLSNKGYHSLIYSGDHDMLIPHQSTQAWIKELPYSITDQWRPWKLQGQIAGYTESYASKMTYASVKGGGHTASAQKPEECLAMFTRWISYQPL